ncbi:MAG: A24 family peptidase [Planctomycetes bacterium]|nr:A24 family peptidase [Planctomycetota bacterium]
MTLTALWIVASAVLGAIFGSFMNVVIFRLPRGLSISQPKWSFCPHCSRQISFRDNLPIVGWLILRGRCRNCAQAHRNCLSAHRSHHGPCFLFRSPMRLFVGKVVPLIGDVRADWPIAAAYFFLFFTLLATAAMDIEAYSVDVRILILAMIVGVLGMAVWFAVADPMSQATAITVSSPRTPSSIGASEAPYQSAPPTGLLPPSMALVGVVMGITWWSGAMLVSALRRRNDGPKQIPAETPEEDMLPDSPSYLNTATQKFRPFPLLLFVLMIVGNAAWVVLWPELAIGAQVPAAIQRGMLALSVLMLMLILASIVHRESDQQIVDEIESGTNNGPTSCFVEAGSLLPACLAGLALFLFLRWTGRLEHTWTDFLALLPDQPALKHAAAGFCIALGALVWSAAIGWFVRIGGTLGFGKEAYGTGDIYIMAAIGSVMGVWGLVFTFFLAALLAILGVVATSFWKSSRAVPFGPWLALGAFAATWVFTDLLGFFGPFGEMLWSILTGKIS